jgi:hypothetical protein
MNSKPLKQQLLRSLRIEGLGPVLVQPVEPNQELWDLHRLSALGVATEEEELRLKALMGDASSSGGRSAALRVEPSCTVSKLRSAPAIAKDGE